MLLIQLPDNQGSMREDRVSPCGKHYPGTIIQELENGWPDTPKSPTINPQGFRRRDSCFRFSGLNPSIKRYLKSNLLSSWPLTRSWLFQFIHNLLRHKIEWEGLFHRTNSAKKDPYSTSDGRRGNSALSFPLVRSQGFYWLGDPVCSDNLPQLCFLKTACTIFNFIVPKQAKHTHSRASRWLANQKFLKKKAKAPKV